MDNTTYLDYAQTSSAVDEILECKQIMQSIFDDFTAAMNVMGGEDVFRGIASDQFQEGFAQMKQRFDEYTGLVQEFAENVKGAKEETEYMERQLKAQAEQLPH